MRRTFFKYISLNMLGALGLSGYIMADTFFVANRLGSDGLAALNLAIPIFGLINGLGILLGIVGAALGFFFGGVATVVAVAAVLTANTPAAFAAGFPVGLFMVGVCLLGLALGVALITAAVWLATWLVPAGFRLAKRAWHRLVDKRGAKQ